jgi:hypothetical protein
MALPPPLQYIPTHNENNRDPPDPGRLGYK